MKVVTFGEIMGRICMPGMLKFRQGLPGPMDITFAGAEANVAASISILGGSSVFVTALPEHEIADAVIYTLNRLSVDTSHIIRTKEGRLGLYFVENGANQRPSKVIYDRDASSIAVTCGSEYDWNNIFADASWFHISGITPALSRTAAETVLTAVKAASANNVKVSLDLNFRKKLWNYDPSLTPVELSRSVMSQILPFVDVIIGNEEDAEDVLGIKAGNTDVSSGKLDIKRYPDVARQICDRYPRVEKVAITLRESISASHNNWGAMLYDRSGDKVFFAPLSEDGYSPYKIMNIVDRIGGGDSFSAGLIFALEDAELKQDNQRVISFAVAASCLCHSIYGDFNYSTRQEVMTLMCGDSSGRVKR